MEQFGDIKDVKLVYDTEGIVAIEIYIILCLSDYLVAFLLVSFIYLLSH